MTKRYAHVSPDAKIRAVEFSVIKLAPKQVSREEANLQEAATQVESVKLITPL